MNKDTNNDIIEESNSGPHVNAPTTVTMGSESLKGMTTNFVDDSIVKINQVRETMLDTSFAVSPMDEQNIATYMAKPIVLTSATGTLTSASPPNTDVFSFDVSDQVTSSLGNNKMWFNKLSGYKLMRGTAVIKIVLNAQPFQAGRLILRCIPNAIGFEALNGSSGSFVSNHNLNLQQKTQHPSVEIDIRDSSAELRIPYLSPTIWYDRELPYGWARVFLTVLSPVSTGSIQYTTYLSFEDFEVAAPQFGPEMSSQGRNNKAQKVMMKERRYNSARPISSTLECISNASDALTNVPFIGSVASWISGASEKVADVFSFFGWSKPINMSSESLMVLKGAHRTANFNGTNTGDVLSLDAGCQLPPLENFAGLKQDEMALAYLKKIPAYFKTITLSTSDTSSSVVSGSATQCALREFCQQGTTTIATTPARNYTYYTAPPFVFLARYFEYWRGSLEITFKMVKTQFHSGRYAINFTPNGAIALNGNQSQYVYREIIDIREHQEVKLILPYMIPLNYLNTYMVGNAIDSVDICSLGSLSVTCVNPLVAASTVANTIDVLMYVNAGDDFELAGQIENPATSVYVAQIGDEAVLQVAKPIGGAPTAPLTLGPSHSSVGEMFSSVKQLINCLKPASQILANIPSNTNASCYGTFTVVPFSLSVSAANDSAAQTLRSPLIGADVLSEISTGYCFSRGGMRYAFLGSTGFGGSRASLIKNTPLFGPQNVSSLLLGTSSTTYGGVTLGTSNVKGCMYNDTTAYRVLDVTVPHIGPTPIRLNHIVPAQSVSSNTVYRPNTRAISWSSRLADIPNYFLRLDMSSLALINENRFHRAAADDYSLGYFIGFYPFSLASM